MMLRWATSLVSADLKLACGMSALVLFRFKP
jgi:hypothetical protein